MRAIPSVDKDGFFIEDVLVSDEFTGLEKVDDRYLISYSVPVGLYKPRWDFENSQWIEGMKDDEIKQLQSTTNSSNIQDKVEYLEQADLDNKELITSLYELLLKQGSK